MANLIGEFSSAAFTEANDVYPSGDGEFYSTYTAATSGVAEAFHFYVSDWWTSASAKLRLRNSSGDLLDEVTLTSAAGTGLIEGVLSGGANIVAGEDYILGFICNTGNIQPFNDNVNSVLERQSASTYATAQDPLVAGSTIAKGQVQMYISGTEATSNTEATTTFTLTPATGSQTVTASGLTIPATNELDWNFGTWTEEPADGDQVLWADVNFTLNADGTTSFDPADLTQPYVLDYFITDAETGILAEVNKTFEASGPNFDFSELVDETSWTDPDLSYDAGSGFNIETGDLVPVSADPSWVTYSGTDFTVDQTAGFIESGFVVSADRVATTSFIFAAIANTSGRGYLLAVTDGSVKFQKFASRFSFSDIGASIPATISAEDEIKIRWDESTGLLSWYQNGVLQPDTRTDTDYGYADSLTAGFATYDDLANQRGISRFFGFGFEPEEVVVEPEGSVTLTTDIANSLVIQHVSDNGTATVGGAYTGDTDQVQVRVMTGATEVVAWQNATLNAGAWTIDLTVAAGLLPYHVEVQNLISSVVDETIISSNVWYVGDIIACLGDSYIDRWFTLGTETPLDYVKVYDGTLKDSDTVGSGNSAFASTVTAMTGRALLMMDYGLDGTRMSQWYLRNTTYNNFIAGFNALGGNIAGVVITLGYNDAYWDDIPDTATHLARTNTLLDNIETDTGLQLPFFMNGTGRGIGRSDVLWRYTIEAELAIVNDRADTYSGALTSDLEISGDDIHLTADASAIQATRSGTKVGQYLTGATVDTRPYIDQANEVSSTETSITVTNGTLPANADVTGFTFSEGESITSANVEANGTITLVHGALSGTSKLQYLYAANPDVANPVVSTTGLSLSPAYDVDLVLLAEDTIPDQMDLGLDVSDSELSSSVVRSFTSSGITASINWVATGNALVSLSSGSGYTASVSAGNNQTIYVRLDSGSDFLDVTTGGVTANGVSDSFSITNRAQTAPVLASTRTVNTVIDQPVAISLGQVSGDDFDTFAIVGGVDQAEYSMSSASLMVRDSTRGTLGSEEVQVAATNAAGQSNTQVVTVVFNEAPVRAIMPKAYEDYPPLKPRS